MNEFDPIKAAREVLMGLTQVEVLVRQRLRRAEQQLAEIEPEHNLMLKLEAYVAGEIKHKRAVLRELESAMEKK